MVETSSGGDASGTLQIERDSRAAHTPHSSRNRILAAIFCAALIRLVVVLARYRYLAAATPENGDFGGEMGWVARSLTLHLGFSSPFYPQSGPTALVPPLFPFILSLIFRVSGLYTPKAALVVLALQTACSALTCIPVYLIGKRFRSQRTGELAAWIWVFYPYSIYYSAGEIWDYALTVLLFTGLLALLLSFTSDSPTSIWLLAGLLLGIAGLVNPSILPVGLILALVQAGTRGGNWRRALLRASALVFMTAAVLLPWSLRNEQLLGSWVPVRDGFWLEAWAGNHGDTSVTNPASAHPASNPTEMSLFLQQGELPYLATKKILTEEWVRHHPQAFAQISLRRALRFWTGFWSVEPAYLEKEPFDIPSCFLCSSISLLMFRGLWSMRRRDMAAFWKAAFVLLLFPCPYYVTHASMDYRQPIEPLVVILISVGLTGRQFKRVSSS